jgi:hypothetical protein
MDTVGARFSRARVPATMWVVWPLTFCGAGLLALQQCACRRLWLCMQAFYCFRPHDRASFLHTVPALQNMEPTVRSDVCSSLQSALDELDALPPTPGAAQNNYRCLGLRPARHHSAQSYLDPSRLSSKPRHDFAASTLQPLAPGRQRASSSWTFIHRAAIMVRV